MADGFDPSDYIKLLRQQALERGRTFPTQADVDMARKYGIDYGDPRLQGLGAPFYGPAMYGDPGAVAEEAQRLRQREPNLSNLAYQDALLANRNPVSALGNDTRATTYLGPYDKPTLGGFMLGKTGDMYAMISPDMKANTIPHEAMHRGMRMMRHDLSKYLPEDVNLASIRFRGPLTRGPGEERAVRYMMWKMHGGREGEGSLGREELNDALMYYTQPTKEGQSRRDQIDALETYAREMIGRNRERGPR